MSNKVHFSEEEWKKRLSPESYRVCRLKGTERAFTGKYWNCHEKGIYHCAACGQPLFSSEDQFNSGTGWPSFTRPKSAHLIETHLDESLKMSRTEVVCSRCDSHLGHVFNDGPKPTGLRFCLNSAALNLVKQ